MKNTSVHRILIPIDFSLASDSALEHGAYLANVYRADIFLLHIMEDVIAYPAEWFNDKNKKPDTEFIKTKIADTLSKYGENITKKYGVYVQTIITNGKLISKIAHIVPQHDINLIVMGIHAVKGVEEFFTKGVGYKIIKLSLCPLITIHEEVKLTGFKSIVLPIDETMHSRQKVSNVLSLATKCKSQVHVLGITQSDDKPDLAKLNTKINTVQEAFESAGLVCIRKLVKGNNVAMEAIKYAEDIKADLLSIMTNHESNMAGIFIGAFPRQIINHCKIPVLSIKPITGPYESSA